MNRFNFCISCGGFAHGQLWCAYCEGRIRVGHDPDTAKCKTGIAERGWQPLCFQLWNASNGRFCSTTIRKLKNLNSTQALRPFAKELLAVQRDARSILKFKKKYIVPAAARAGVACDHAMSWARALSSVGMGEVIQPLARADSLSQKNLGKGERRRDRFVVLASFQNDPSAHYLFADDVVTTGSTACAAFDAMGKPAHFSISALFYRVELK